MKRIIISLLVLIIAISLTACSLGNSNNLAGTSWILNSWENETLSPMAYGITLEFEHDGSVTGKSAVNGYGSAYKIKKNDALTFNNTTITEMASIDDKRNQVEAIYMKLLSEVDYYKVNGENLTLINKDKNEIMTFHAVRK